MKQTAQTKKEQLIAEAFAARRELLDVASVLSEAEEDTVFLGHWTVKDLLGLQVSGVFSGRLDGRVG